MKSCFVALSSLRVRANARLQGRRLSALGGALGGREVMIDLSV